jgi:DNA sulfur modification protein DndB
MFGDWVYYSCQFPIRELGSRVEYANKIHQAKDLSLLIQRVLDEGERATRIAEYLTEMPERFFNSLVLATYGGDPQWLEIGNLRSNVGDQVVEQIPPDVIRSIGFLQLNGDEKVFAVDGQHRLAGIKRALALGADLGDDDVPVLLIGHKKSSAGLRRTRRLFTTLNKTAVPVNKRDIIALDEDDVMAIIARRLVENHPWFIPPKIAVIANSNLPATNHEALTTISSLYDILKRVFEFETSPAGSMPDPEPRKSRRAEKLRFNRPTEERLEQYIQSAIEFFGAMAEAFPPIAQLFGSKVPRRITSKYRHANGGNLLFRPVGLEIIVRLAIEWAQQHGTSLPEGVKALSDLPQDLSKRPLRDVIWNPRQHVIILKGRSLALSIGRHMLGLSSRLTRSELQMKYREAVGDPNRLLPRPIRSR